MSRVPPVTRVVFLFRRRRVPCRRVRAEEISVLCGDFAVTCTVNVCAAGRRRVPLRRVPHRRVRVFLFRREFLLRRVRAERLLAEISL